MAKAQHVWASSAGLPSTGRILGKIQDAILKTKVGQEFREDWVLSQAVALVKKQHPPSGKVPKGFYIDTSEVTPEEQHVRKANIRKACLKQKKSTGHTLSNIGLAIDKNINIDSNDELEGNTQPGSLLNVRLDGPGGLREGEGYVEHWEGSFRELQNSKYLERVNRYLNYIGLSVNQVTAIHALEHLGHELKKKIIGFMGEDTLLAPFITLDNIDFQQHIHTSTVEQESTMWHGSWGYTKPIDLAKILPTPTKISDWELTLKSQIPLALVKYVAKPIDTKKIPYPSDNSISGVGKFYNSVLNQTGLSQEKYASQAQVWEGHLGMACIVASDESGCGDFRKGANFATLVEGSWSMSAGDVGRMLRVWKCWSVNAHGMKRLKHYANYLPHLIGTGTSIKRLQDLYLICIPLLRDFLHRLKGHSGLNNVYQSHTNNIDHSSLRSFLRMAHQHDITTCTPYSTLPKGRPTNMYYAGMKVLQSFAREGKLKKFQWPTAEGFHAQTGGRNNDDSGTEDSSIDDGDSE
ncbi:uncharacterized protein MELLADRAFT_110465 [Melampsora larici-populina 98AG31]|uniref:DUF6589 domain-containing protein n=1 Tax=Melampsora larici-populina (strain 98AG31 / pathotype 3-4-7) TaxID=747676 RepID=F4RZW4_MELLP|nr:uncharacterized protein MELLADRAFT_110465 [Melampsora larici-populina 98AG31]EGG02116.1 hypothetical protein MELLADRAFT_110465 [Melampsora larici-populina 98AG31]